MSKTPMKFLVDNFQPKSKRNLQTLQSVDGSTEICYVETAVKKVQTVKVFAFSSNKAQLEPVMSSICDYRNLLRSLEEQRVTKFDDSNDKHNKMLSELWDSLKFEEVNYERKGSHWRTLGFQGNDPATDLRGMGMLGLSNLHYFATEHREEARQLLMRSHNPTIGCSFAITGIDLTNLCYQFLLFGVFKSIFYYENDHYKKIDIESFRGLFVKVFCAFDKFWFDSKPSSFMEYGPVREKFEDNLRTKILTEHTMIV